MADFDDKEFEFDEDTLREIETEETLHFSQQLPHSKSSNENKSPENSSRKNRLLGIFEQAPEVNEEPEQSSRKTLLLNLMSKSTPASPQRAPLKNIPSDSFSKKPSSFTKRLEVKTRSPFKRPLSPKEPITLIRKFPGPAGLLSLSKVSPKKARIDIEDDETESTFCSQDTRKLFTDGAWRRMVNELPKDYLTGREISSVKNPGKSRKIPILAGIIDKIDWCAANPRVTLKDISDSIEGMMHKDIFDKYPNVLQPGVVVLLRDVGILNLRGMKASLTTSIIFISPMSIMAAYNDHGRVITTPELTQLIKQDEDNVEEEAGPVIQDLDVDDELFEEFTEREEDVVQVPEDRGPAGEIPGSTFGDHLLEDSDDEQPISEEKNEVSNDAMGDSDDEIYFSQVIDSEFI